MSGAPAPQETLRRGSWWFLCHDQPDAVARGSRSMPTEGGDSVLKDVGQAPSGVVSEYVQADHAKELSGAASTRFSCGALSRAANVPQLVYRPSSAASWRRSWASMCIRMRGRAQGRPSVL